MPKILKKQDNRREFIDTLIELAEKDPAIVLVIPDVGFNYVEEFSKRFPDRFFNLGVTEQSATIIAAGMALAGKKPYLYSMINFVAFRPFEMVRNAIASHNANVKILGVKGSEAYKFLGFSHNLLFENEDTYILKKYLKCYLPKNPSEVRSAIIKSYKSEKPTYIRL